MKILYLECAMGAAGDMLSAALLELVKDKQAFVEKLNNLGIPGVEYRVEASEKCGIKGTKMRVVVDGEEEEPLITEGEKHKFNSHSSDMEDAHHTHHHHTHHHRSLQEIKEIVKKFQISDKIKNDILSVYRLIAEAESKAHGVLVTEIHFHEVGMMDAIADVTAVCLLMDYLQADKVVVSPINVGSGQVKCAHGVLPVPAPATAYILRNLPVYSGEIKSELCTPTGAALLKFHANEFGGMPLMKIASIGYGMGTKDFNCANCVRAFLGEDDNSVDIVAELSCNLDDMTAEAIGFASEMLFEAGALDVFTIPAQMKKSRPGILFSVICHEKDKETMIGLMFRHTTTLGVRENICKRYILERYSEAIVTKYGEVRKKISEGYGVYKEKYEFEDIARIAKDNDLSLAQVLETMSKCRL